MRDEPKGNDNFSNRSSRILFLNDTVADEIRSAPSSFFFFEVLQRVKFSRKNSVVSSETIRFSIFAKCVWISRLMPHSKHSFAKESVSE